MKKIFTIRTLISVLVFIISIQTVWSQILYSGASSCVSGSSSTWLTAAN